MSPGGGWRYKTKKKSVSNKKRTLYVLLSLSSVCTGFLFILPVKVYHTDNSYNARGYGYNNCSHLYSLSSFLFLTSSKPAKRVNITAIITEEITSILFISLNTDDNNNAVIIYLAMSISHLPNSFFIMQRYEKNIEVYKFV